MINVSVVLPVYNEEENIPILAEQLVSVFTNLQDQYQFETILVNDGSTDDSLKVMLNLCHRFPAVNWRVINLNRNWGLSGAMAAGFDAALGEFVVTLDTDLQNDPADIPAMLAKTAEYDVVIGIRARRNDTFVKKMSSKIANFIRNTLTRENIRDTGCSLKVYRLSYLRKIKLFTGMHRFLPTLLKMEGARVHQMEVKHHERRFGVPKYHLFNRLIGPLLDLLAVMWMQNRHLAYRYEEISSKQTKN
jgi:glycosyltransferase involved in cell wall biosynthesis